MADEIKKRKNVRKTRLASFTRKRNSVQSLLDGGESTADRFTEVLRELKEAFHTLEVSQEKYAEVADEEDLEAEGDFLETPSSSLETLEAAVLSKIKLLKNSDKSNQAKARLERGVNSFGAPCKLVADLCATKEISCEDLRTELEKIGSTYEKLQADTMLLDPSMDIADLLDRYQTQVVAAYENCKQIGLKYMKDVPTAVTTPVVSADGEHAVAEGGSVRSFGFSQTKRETVMLPKFSGDEKTAFLKYPVWKTQWLSHISEYEVKYRSTMLLNHLDDKAMTQIIGHENDYEKSMELLDKYYNDARKIIKACLDEVRSHPNISTHDYKALVSYKKCLVNNYTRLKACKLDHEMSNTAALGALVRKFPIQEAVKWQEYLAKQERDVQARPFPAFMLWLEDAGASWELLAASGTGVKGKAGTAQVHLSLGEEEDSNRQSKPCFKCGEVGHWKRNCPQSSSNGAGKSTGGSKGAVLKTPKERRPPIHKKFHCALHKGAPGRGCSTWSCVALKYTPFEERLKLMTENGDCSTCCGDCPANNCQAKVKRTCGGGKEGRGCGSNHLGHELWCQNARVCFSTQLETVLKSAEDPNDQVLLQLMKIPSVNPDRSHETVLWDSACSDIFVRHDHARAMKFPYKEKRLQVATLGGHIREIHGVIYTCRVKDQKGRIYEFQAHGLDRVTGDLGRAIDKNVMRQLFPDIIGAHSLTGSSEVDYLIGLGKASWQPQRVQKALGGGDFWLWENEFGSCLGGTHPLISSFTSRSDNLYTVLKTAVLENVVDNSLQIPTCSVFNAKISAADGEDFFQTEQLGTYVEPRCGACRCGRCPVPGSRFSFREESELKLIEENLTYDEENHCWVAGYPYLYPRSSLKGSREIALKSMVSTEKSLARKGNWGNIYNGQIQDMLTRGVARKVPKEELAVYPGPINYLPHLAAINPRSESTPVRICFDASRSQGGGPGLNQILAKGPDKFLNNLAGVITNFRNGRVAAKGDIRKMYNCVRLKKEDAFMQCFVWRNLDPEKEPDTYQVTVNNIGVKPAGAIAAIAFQKSADRFSNQFPVAAKQLKEKSYVDDLGLTAKNMEVLKKLTREADLILGYADMHVKKWVLSGEKTGNMVRVGESSELVNAEGSEYERMLGVTWDPDRDVFKFRVQINLSPLKQKSRTGADLTREELQKNPPSFISRRQYYSQIQSLFDPIGLLAPILLKAKMILRKTWEGACSALKWDDCLPEDLVKEIVEFFLELYELESLKFPRSIWPQEEAVGKPELVVFSDGSIVAFGAVVYVRWKLTSGAWWPALVTSKSKIGPKNRITVPRLELNGAVLAKRLKEFVVGQLDLEFANIFHLVDSSTVLGYLHKADSKLKPFEGIRVSEIQTSGEFLQGRLKNWSWVEGELNPADWVTKPRSVSELGPNSFWQRGPDFLTREFSEWPIKLDFRTDRLEGELQLKGSHFVGLTISEPEMGFDKLLNKVSRVDKLYRIGACMLKWCRAKGNPKGVAISSSYTSEEIKRARKFWIRHVQLKEVPELRSSTAQLEGEKVRGRYRRLSPFLDQDQIWRVGLRVREYAPFTADKVPPAFVPRDSRFTVLLMKQAHESKHSGVEETVARFRLNGFWTTDAAKLAKTIKLRCVICRYLDKQPIRQIKGGFPAEQMINPMAWGEVEMDLFGPFVCRSDVNKRSSVKIWGLVIVDRNSGATHCDVLMNYGAEEVVKALRRFSSLRGWPAKIVSDPGSQLVSSSGNLESWWKSLEEPLKKFAADSQFAWDISPANSPWRQGRCESRIKSLKRLLAISASFTRLSPLELQTVLMEAANLSNERPIGVVRTPKSDGTFSVITPNSLLMGRSRNLVPDDVNLGAHLKQGARYELIQQVTAAFWDKWTQEVTPTRVIRQKWHEIGRNLKCGDVVLVHDRSPIKGRYILGIVESVKMGTDGQVRSCNIGYTISNKKDAVDKYSGGRRISVSRSVQRLTLLLPIEEQNENLDVVDNVVRKAGEI